MSRPPGPLSLMKPGFGRVTALPDPGFLDFPGFLGLPGFLGFLGLPGFRVSGRMKSGLRLYCRLASFAVFDFSYLGRPRPS